MKMSDQIRAALLEKAKEVSIQQIARECDLSQPSLWKFANNKGELRSSTLDKLIGYLGLRLVQDTPPKKSAPKKSPKK